MNRPLEIRDIHNISLTGSNIKSNVYPQLVARFPCQYSPRSKYGMHMGKILYLVPDPLEVYCAVIHLINVTNSTFNNIRKYGSTFYIGIAMVVLPYFGPWEN